MAVLHIFVYIIFISVLHIFVVNYQVFVFLLEDSLSLFVPSLSQRGRSASSVSPGEHFSSISDLPACLGAVWCLFVFLLCLFASPPAHLS